MAVLALPLFFAALLGLLIVVTRVLDTAAPTRVGLVDHAGVLDAGSVPASIKAGQGGVIRFVSVSNDADARRAVRERRVAACYVIEADYRTTGRVTAFRAPPRSPVDVGLGLDERDALASLLRERLTAGEPDDRRRQLIVRPLEGLRIFFVGNTGDPVPAADTLSLARAFLGPFGVAFFLSLGILFSAGFLEQATSEERESRLLEVILTMTGPVDFVLGKVAGLGGAGLVQIAMYAAFVAASGPALAGVIQLAPGQIGWSALYFLLGYLLFAALLAGTSIVVRSAHESVQIATLWTSLSALPIMLLLVAEPNGPLARILSYIPFTAPVTMLLRVGRGNVPPIDLIGAALIIAGTTWAALWASAQLLRASMVMQGKPLTLPTLVAWLKAR